MRFPRRSIPADAASGSAGTRPTTGAAYTDGRGAFIAPVEHILDGAGITGSRRLRFDALVVGAGAGGAPVAKELAQGGMRVAILEEGPRFEPDRFNARPGQMTPLLYRDAGQTMTLGNVPILLPLGRGLGGTSLINSATCFRTPPAVLAMWGRRFGLESLTPETLDPFFRRVEREINVAKVPPEIAGRNAEVVRRGAEALGWSGDYIHRNARGCVGSGVCNFGCPTSAKQHVGITYIPRAWEAGALTCTGARVTRILTAAGRATGVLARTSAGGALQIDADVVVLAAGAIHTPLILRRSGLGERSGELGGNLSIHPATAVRALFEEHIDMAVGVPQSYYIDEFADQGIMFEGAGGPPDYTAASFASYSSEDTRELMRDYRHMSQFGAMVSDRSRGLVRERHGRVEIRYDLLPEDLAAFKLALERLGELYAAAGAHTVIYPVEGLPPQPAGELGALRAHELRPRDVTLMAFHPLGTARADAWPARGVVDADLRLHGLEGLHIADASVVPSSLGVNPQMTIMALATRLAYHLLDLPAPDHEPHPETLAEPRIAHVHEPAPARETVLA
ncbi:MAG TPA: GMC family oxidoreductase [Solirubrobacteraceae bacterium]|nr:GMC family oxidoreductase [Solirubrobacteraceae bacterium]